MPYDESWIKTYKYIFSLAGALPDLESQKPPSQGAIYRMIAKPAYWTAYFISVSISETTGELRFGVEQPESSISESSVEQFNSNMRWRTRIWDAFKNNSQLPTEIPETHKVLRENRALSATQIAWFQDKMHALSSDHLVNCGHPMNFERGDQGYRQGQILKEGQKPHVFVQWENDGSPCIPQNEYFTALYQLAASSLKDESSVAYLVNIQHHFFGGGPHPTRTTFTLFPLIE